MEIVQCMFIFGDWPSYNTGFTQLCQYKCSMTLRELPGRYVLSNIFLYSATTPNSIAHEYLLNVVFSLVYILIGSLLWIFSGKLSVKMTNGDYPSNENSSLTSIDLQRVLFSVLGLYFVGHSVPKLVSALMSMYSMNGVPITRILFSSIGTITELIIGLGIFFGSQGLVRLLYSIKTVGFNKENDSEDKE